MLEFLEGWKRSVTAKTPQPVEPAVEPASTSARPFTEFVLAEAAGGAHFELVQIDSSGIVRLVAKSKAAFRPADLPLVRLDEREIPFLQSFQFRRPASVSSSGETAWTARLAFEYLVPVREMKQASSLSLQFGASRLLRLEAPFSFLEPHYGSLLDSPDVFHREDIYTSGPPNTIVCEEVIDFATRLAPPVLDFGCGRGVLVRHLLQRGIDAYGLELDVEVIRATLPSGKERERITLYDGSFPSPFKDKRFSSVMCSEVLEHIPDYRAAIQDIARITTGTAIFTVPDASAIPMGFKHGIVPWHLLEGTHVNFFNQRSLGRALSEHFSTVEFQRINPAMLSSTLYHESLVAVCRK